MKEIRIIKAWCESEIERYEKWQSERDYHDATNELQLLNTLNRMLDSVIGDTEIPKMDELLKMLDILNKCEDKIRNQKKINFKNLGPKDGSSGMIKGVAQLIQNDMNG